MKYEVIGYNDCNETYRLNVESVDYSWDRKTTIIHVELPKIKEERKEK